MFDVFSGVGNFRVKTDRLEEMMRDNGWKFELEPHWTYAEIDHPTTSAQ